MPIADPPNKPPWFPNGDPAEPSNRNTLLYFYDTYQSYDLIYVSYDEQGGLKRCAAAPLIVTYREESSSNEISKYGTDDEAGVGDLSDDLQGNIIDSEDLLNIKITGTVEDRSKRQSYQGSPSRRKDNWVDTTKELFSTKIALNIFRQTEYLDNNSDNIEMLEFTVSDNVITFYLDIPNDPDDERELPTTATLVNAEVPSDFPTLNRAVVSPVINSTEYLLFDRFPIGDPEYIELIYDIIYAYRLNSDRNWIGKDADDDGTEKIFDLVNWDLSTEDEIEFDIQGVIKNEVSLFYYYSSRGGNFYHYRKQIIDTNIPTLKFDSSISISMYSMRVKGNPNDVRAVEEILSGNRLLFSEIQNQSIESNEVTLRAMLFNEENINGNRPPNPLIFDDFFDHFKDAVFWYRANNPSTDRQYEMPSDPLNAQFYKIDESIKQEYNRVRGYYYFSDKDFLDAPSQETTALTTTNENIAHIKRLPRYLWRNNRFFVKHWIEQINTEGDVELRYAKGRFHDLESEESYFQRVLEYTWEYNDTELINEKMADSLRVKEIHQALEAQRYATYTSTLDGEEKPRVANIGYYIERIARILGINVLADGTAYTPRLINKVEIPDDGGIRDIELPEDSPHLNNQWGFGKESITSLRFDDDFMDFGVDDTDAPLSDLGYEAMVYPIATNKFVEDESTGEVSQIKAGGVALVHNLPQLYDVIMQDVDKGLGLQEAGAYAIRSPEDSITGEVNLCTYEGLHSLVAENAYMISEVSRRASKAQVNSQLARMMLMSLMNITGLPIEPASFQTTINKDEEPQKIYYPRFAKSSPRLFELWVILMDNIGTLLGEAYNLPPEVQEKIQNLTRQEFDDLVNSIKEESEQWRR
ncbi:MAG: hypothetical protein ACLFRN_07245 [Halothece sp.]